MGYFVIFSENIKTANPRPWAKCFSDRSEKTYSFKPQTACILNISKDHLDRYDNYESYYKTKFKINNNNKLFYNIEDKILKQKFSGLSNTIPFSIKNDNSFLIENNKIINKSNNKFFEISKIKLIGKHNIENILAVLHMLSEIKIEGSLNCSTFP